MSARNSAHAKRRRRREREVHAVGGCAICESLDVAFVDDDPESDYPALCKRHLAYAVATLFGYDGEGTRGPSPIKQRLHAQMVQQNRSRSIFDDYPRSQRAMAQRAIGAAVS